MSLATVVQALTDFAEECETEYTVAYNESDDGQPPAEALAVVLLAIRECRAGLATMADTVERDLLALMDEKKLVIEGVGEIEAKKSIRRTKWDWQALMPRLVAAICDEPGVLCDPVDGTSHPPFIIGLHIAERLRDCVSFSAAKVTGLRPLGLEPDEFCEEDEGHWSVRLPPRAIR